MKKYLKHTFAIAFVAFVAFTLSACEDVADNAIPHIASPVLVEVSTLGKYTPLDQVVLSTKISDLDKSGIMDNAVGIDTVPASLASIQVLKDIGGATETFFSPLSLTQGLATIVADWTDILPAGTLPEDGEEVKFEYFETYENIPFRKVYKLDYSPTAFTAKSPVLKTTVDGEEKELPIAADGQTYTFSYQLISVNKTGVSISIEQQINDGEFVLLTPPAEGWPTAGTIAYLGSDFVSGDKVALRITGVKGILTSIESFAFTVE